MTCGSQLLVTTNQTDCCCDKFRLEWRCLLGQKPTANPHTLQFANQFKFDNCARRSIRATALPGSLQ
jgi:hypothetical protein